ncbi:MAG: metal-dependent transcriptional regulator [Spirochaetales bacterium]|nr:metal-dependent transcriptional regulator [Spirochaetales bacterium]
MSDEKPGIQEIHQKYPALLDYLSEMLLIQRDYGDINNVRIAARLAVSKAAVTQAINRLKTLGFARQNLYGVIHFTPEGQDLASKILIRHYLVEHLLIRKLNYPWHKSDEEARRIQAVISDEFTAYLYDAFDRPQTCPHGNPFPGSDLEKKLVKAPRFSQVRERTEVTMIRITEEGEAVEGLLKFCNSIALRPGKKVVIVPDEEHHTINLELDGTSVPLPQGYDLYLCYE